MRRIVMGVSGASGMPLAHALLGRLRDLPDLETHCIITRGAGQVLAREFPGSPQALGRLASVCHEPEDLGAGPASGSWWHSGGEAAAMVVAPCSMGSLAAIAAGLARNLLQRAADVALKERMRLVLVTRESPLSPVQLRNMLELARGGAVIMPFSPGFYFEPATLGEMLDQFCGRVLDQLGLPAAGPRWG